jgi:hypothetical protein
MREIRSVHEIRGEEMNIRVLSVLVPAVALIACSSATEPEQSVATALAQMSPTLTEGEPGMSAIATPAVRVEDQYGAPMSGVMVTFSVTAGGGSVAYPMRLTNAEGRADAGSWTLGPQAGENLVVANVVGAGSVTFKAVTHARVVVNQPTLPTAELLEQAPFRLRYVNGRAMPFTPPGQFVIGAVLVFRNGSFSLTYTYGASQAGTETVTGSYLIQAFEIQLYATTAGNAPPVIASMHGDSVEFTATSYVWPLAANLELFARATPGRDLSGTWNASGALNALDLKSFTLVLHQRDEGTLEGTWTATRITCGCQVSGYVWPEYSFSLGDSVLILLRFGTLGAPGSYLDPYGGIRAEVTDAANMAATMDMAYGGDGGAAVYYGGDVKLSR